MAVLSRPSQRRFQCPLSTIMSVYEWDEDGTPIEFGNAGCEPPQPETLHDIKDLKSASADSVFDVAFYINTTSTFDESTMWNKGNRGPRRSHVPWPASSGSLIASSKRWQDAQNFDRPHRVRTTQSGRGGVRIARPMDRIGNDVNGPVLTLVVSSTNVRVGFGDFLLRPRGSSIRWFIRVS
ncbi:hypothetical protein SAMN04488026_105615 [Aliiruegeria lutimaris]|uniref:Uncharacterized protein n=1 Tax=Aliiruegeria lutimaris TaxID=571298 RepID=A0A1G9F8T0_9RHOB|nr:hypothetical protein SAMN04488026_105615 [Aliiruegeria lutimaris]